MSKRLSILLFALFLTSLTIAPEVLLAQSCTNSFCPLAPSDGSKIGTLYSSSPDLPTFLSNLFAAALSIGAILAVLRLTYAGYQYMTSDAWSSKHHAKEIIGNVVLGMLLLLSIYLILYQINPNILKLNFIENIKPLPAAPASTNTSGSAPLTQHQLQAQNNITQNANGTCQYTDPMGGVYSAAC
ncbi:MAG TPA: hypothetical protein VHD38_01350 [Candidatus Paceibacterota bacterium]|nr:hypothetical protein [Candidatus Paceibacterota bacterium]